MADNASDLVVLCDASPLIFLAKLNRLDLIELGTQSRAVVLRCVVEEVLSERAPPIEAERLRTWLAKVQQVDFQKDLFPSRALSLCGRASLAWAYENKVDWFLVDERLLRRFARERGIRVLGFCGLLVRAAEQKILRPSEAQSLLETSIRENGLRISIQLYQRILERLREIK